MNFLVNNRVKNELVNENMKMLKQYTIPDKSEIACFNFINDECTVSFYTSEDFEELVPWGCDAVKELKGLGSSVTMNDCTVVSLV